MTGRGGNWWWVLISGGISAIVYCYVNDLLTCGSGLVSCSLWSVCLNGLV